MGVERGSGEGRKEGLQWLLVWRFIPKRSSSLAGKAVGMLDLAESSWPPPSDPPPSPSELASSLGFVSEFEWWSWGSRSLFSDYFSGSDATSVVSSFVGIDASMLIEGPYFSLSRVFPLQFSCSSSHIFGGFFFCREFYYRARLLHF